MTKQKTIKNVNKNNIFEVDLDFVYKNYGSLKNYLIKCFEEADDINSYCYHKEDDGCLIFRINQKQ